MENFNEVLAGEVEFINDIIMGYMPKEEGNAVKAIEAMNYSINSQGKRIRPMIILEVYKLCGGSDYTVVYPYMAALECIHSYSLVHDDLPAMDNDDFRRGQPTTHKKYGEDFGILAGDGLLNYAYELLFNDLCDNITEDIENRIKAARTIAHKSGIYGMVGGQSLDVFLTNKTMDKEQLDFIFRLKTGALIEAAFIAGAYLAGADDNTIEKLSKVGSLVGYAFQIKDDILDVTGNQEIIGKPVFSDEKNNKTTYVTLYGLDKAQQDVDEMSNEAIDTLNEIGQNEFLIDLVKMLITRNK